MGLYLGHMDQPSGQLQAGGAGEGGKSVPHPIQGTHLLGVYLHLATLRAVALGVDPPPMQTVYPVLSPAPTHALTLRHGPHTL